MTHGPANTTTPRAAVQARGALDEIDQLAGPVGFDTNLQRRVMQINTLPTKPAAVDLLTQAICHVRPFLHLRRPLRARLTDFWAAIAASTDLGASDVLDADFLALADDTGLAADLGHHRDADLRHVISWARLERDPFGAKP